MELEVSYSLDNGEQFWDELADLFAAPCDSHAEIDNVLRSYLDLTTKYKEVFLPSIDDIGTCAERLLASQLFTGHADYVRRQIVHCLLQEDAPDVLLVIVSLLLHDGRNNEGTFELMSAEGAFVRLLELIQSVGCEDDGDGAGLHRLLMDLMYEMSRIQRLRIEDLVLVEDDFVKHLFYIIEQFSDDAKDPYHYPVIRVLLVLNEQFMVSAHDPAAGRAAASPPTNKVIKVLSMCGNMYKTFGENIILLLNREDETSLQLLTLKLLYLLFTTPSTYEYFYTNDLRVLVDILIRNLLDLPEEAAPLRHTYLRVLHPLLAHTQLRHPPHYKREELRKLLGILVRSDFSGLQENSEKIIHFEEVDETTKRLVVRCSQVEWLIDQDQVTEQLPDKAVTNGDKTVQKGDKEADFEKTDEDASKSGEKSPSASSSASLALSEAGVAVPSENPSKPPPTIQKQKPEPPKSRRWRTRRRDEDDSKVQDDPISRDSRTLDRQTSFERVAESEPPTPGTHTVRIDVSLASSPSHAPNTPASAKTPPASTGPPRLRANQSCLSPHPPAVPPPRRSSHSVPPHSEYHPSRQHRNPPPVPPHKHPSPQPPQLPGTSTATVTASVTTNGQARKPDPPKTRRWWIQQGQQITTTRRSSAATTPSESAQPSPQIMATTTLSSVAPTPSTKRADSLETGLDKLYLGQE